MAERVRLPAAGYLPLPLAAPVAMLAVLMAPAAHAELKVVPAVELRSTYTDNVSLAADGSAHSQFVGELTPSLTISDNTPRLKLGATVREHLYAYSGERLPGTNGSAVEAQADAKARLIDDLLYFDAVAGVSQRSVSAFGPQPAGNGYSAANRSQVRTYSLSPYLAHQFGGFAAAQLRYTRNSLHSGDLVFGDSTSNGVAASLVSGPNFHSIGWGLQANREDLEDSLGRKSSSSTANADLRWRLSNELSVKGGTGYDKYDFGQGGSSSGRSHTLGVAWTPSLRTSVDASAGKRFFGPTYALRAVHRSRRSVWDINYTDGITTTRDQFLQPGVISTADMLDRLFMPTIPDPVARRQAVEAYIRATNLPATMADNTTYFGNRYLHQKQLQLSAGFNTARTTALLSLNAARRNALSSQQAESALPGPPVTTLNDDTRTETASLAGSYRITARGAVNVGLSKSRATSLSSGLRSNQTSLSMALTQQFSQKLRGAVELRRSQGNAAVASAGQYHENAVSASLLLQL